MPDKTPTTEAPPPVVVVIGGPNGAGKPTCARTLLPAELALRQFVNADVIAQGLAGFAPEMVALQAGRLMLERLEELARDRRDFSFESTLSARTFVRFLKRLKADGYQVHLVYLWLESPDLAVERVAARVSRGGHHIPTADVRRRYWRSLRNSFHRYLPLAEAWTVCNNSGHAPELVASGGAEGITTILNSNTYERIQQQLTERGEDLADGSR